MKENEKALILIKQNETLQLPNGSNAPLITAVLPRLTVL